MRDFDTFIEGLQILKEYSNPDKKYPFGAEHDEFYIWGIDIKSMPIDKAQRLYDLGFYVYVIDSEDYMKGEKYTEEGWKAIQDKDCDTFYFFT